MIPINVVVEMLRLALDFADKTVSKFDEAKYVKAVNEIYGHVPDYKELDVLEESIKEATDISTKEKAELLFALADKKSEIRAKELEYKQEFAEIINKGFEKRCNLFVKIALCVFTAGLSLVPEAYLYFKDDDQDELYIDPKSK